MISPVLLWIPALALALAAVAGGAFWAWRRRAVPAPRPLPPHWKLSARPVFSTDERRVHRLLREALPQHVILSKLPLVRFSQPDDPNEVRYWYELLGTAHVAFAICSPNGRVLAAIDLDSAHGPARRTLQIKQAVLAACRVRYLRCAMDSLPTVAELQSLVPANPAPRPVRTAAPASPQAIGAAGLTRPPERVDPTIAPRRDASSAIWQDSVPFDDSFFALEIRQAGNGTTDFGGLGAPSRHHGFDARDELGGSVSDDPAQR